MKTTLVTLLLLTACRELGAQEYHFPSSLRAIANKDSLKWARNEIKAINNTLQRPDTTGIHIEKKTKWTLLYYHHFGTTEYFNGLGLHIHRDTVIMHKHKPDTFTTYTIFQKFELVYPDSGIHQKMPFVFERADRYNRQWVPISRDGEYLLLRMVHSYPYGNQTSWYREYIYYFKRTN